MPPTSRHTDEQIREAAEAHGWSLRETARALGLHHSTIIDRMKRLRNTPPVPPASPMSWPPVGYEPSASRPGKASAGETETTIVIADPHFPYQNVVAWDCALGIVADVQPNRIVIDGDFLDLESLSRHPKSRPDLAKLGAEFYAGNLALDSLQEASPSSDIVYLEGNHEHRASRYANEYGQLDGILSVPVSLFLEPKSDYHRETSQLRGIRWVPLRMQPFAIGNVRYLHGVSETKYHAAFHAEALGPRNSERFLISAHMHGWQSFASASGFVAYSCPWLGEESQAVFQSYVKGRPRPWHLGVLLVEECGAATTVTPIFIHNGRALVGGRVIQAAA